MKKTIITMLIALVAMVAGAETYSYLAFTKTGGTTVTYSVENIKVTYDDSNVIVTNNDGTATIALADVQDMYFTNEPATAFKRGDVNGDGNIDVSDVTTLIAYILGNQPEVFIVEAAYCNDDSNIDVSDVTALIAYILGSGTW